MGKKISLESRVRTAINSLNKIEMGQLPADKRQDLYQALGRLESMLPDPAPKRGGRGMVTIVAGLVQSGKIKAIKLVRQHSGTSLQYAKGAVEGGYSFSVPDMELFEIEARNIGATVERVPG